MRHIGPFLCGKLFTGGYWAVFRPIFLPNYLIFLMLQPYNSIFWTPTDFSNIKISSPYPKLSLGNFGFLAGQRVAPWQAFLAQIAQNYPFWGQTLCFLAEYPIFGDIIHKKVHHHAPTPKRQHFCVTQR